MRNFTNIHSFKRHLIQKHNDQNSHISFASESYSNNNISLCHDIVSDNVKSNQFKTYNDFEEFLTTKTCEQLIIDPLITLQQFDNIVILRKELLYLFLNYILILLYHDYLHIK